METTEDDEDLKLAKASVGLLSDLERDLPKILWKPSKTPAGQRRVHRQVKKRDLNRILQLIEPFQAEPQLLDAKLKSVLPPIVDAYLEYIQTEPEKHIEHADFQTAVCSLLYTLCKVRGYKVIVGFLNNEPRYLEPILDALEKTLEQTSEQSVQWQVPYVLLLWLSHLLLTPFDLSSISTKSGPVDGETATRYQLPPLAARVLRVGLAYLPVSTKAQEAATAMLVRLCIRPDVIPLGLADLLLADRLPKLEGPDTDATDNYESLGSLRLVAGIGAAAELSHLVPNIYRSCEQTFDENAASSLSANAVAKKMMVKIFRNVAILSMRSAASAGPLLSFLQTTSVLENVIDYLLRSLGDKDTPVRYAAAKAISLIVLELDPEMGHEVIQAVLDSFKEDMPRNASILDFATANPLKWHGLTLALSHSLFKRSASPGQLPDIFDALISALQFQQRTATGTTLGTNVRDAANFGIWSLARRYTTAELLPVQVTELHKSNQIGPNTSIVQLLAVQLILSSCLDPAGNIRRGSSAALQELVGRHPDQILHGISLVQIVDYQAVSLRKRAMIDVVNKAAALHKMYRSALLDGLFGWRGVWSADVPSRDWTASAIAQLASPSNAADLATVQQQEEVLEQVLRLLRICDPSEVESMHGYATIAADIMRELELSTEAAIHSMSACFQPLQAALKDFSTRTLRSEFPSAIARFITSFCNVLLGFQKNKGQNTPLDFIPFDIVENLTDRLMARHEDCSVIPDLAHSLLAVIRGMGRPLGYLRVNALSEKVDMDGSKSSVNGAGRAIALGTLAALYSPDGLSGREATTALTSLCGLMTAMNVEWRVVGARALQLVVESISTAAFVQVDESIVEMICVAIHRGLNDYTIDERGDVGSLVRLECITCASKVFATDLFHKYENLLDVLKGDICRLSLEKLDKVRLQAAQCRSQMLDASLAVTDIASVSSVEYFEEALSSLPTTSPPWMQKALLQGCISCAGVGAEALLQASRHVLIDILSQTDDAQLEHLLATLTTILKDQLAESANLHPTLELLAFLLDMRIPQRLDAAAFTSTFKWRNLLSLVQKSHHKSNDIPKILAAVHGYIGLAEVASIRGEVLKKLVSMLKTNPYPRVRIAVAEALWVVTNEEGLKRCDWARPVAQNGDVVDELKEKYVE